jgi:hypothetical protein
MCRLLFLIVCFNAVAGLSAAADIRYPGPMPAQAVAELSDNAILLSNEAISARWSLDEGRVRLISFSSAVTAPEHKAGNGELFVIQLTNGDTLSASDFSLREAAVLERISGRHDARRQAERFDGLRVRLALISPDQTLAVEWEAELRDESNYLIQRVTLTPQNQPLALDTLSLIDLDAPSAKVAGVTQGAPVVADKLFFALEHPMSESTVIGNRVSCTLKRGQALDTGRKLTLSSVMGATPPGQLRRAFLYYVERERAHPYRPFLHYNSWYDIAWGDRKFNESEAIEAIEIMARELVTKRGVKVDSFVFDDGWDDNKTLWQFHDGFPNGFKPLKKKAEEYDSAVGTWLSPFGGYGEAREQRLQFGTAHGFEVNRNGFSLAGERYYARFLEICSEMIRDDGVNFFKFDGMGPGNNRLGGEEFLEDIEALMRLAGELRGLNPDLFISATTGTWATPYFLWPADNIWRSSEDMNFSGKGSQRQQWINYRDTHTYRNVVRQGPLYPLNSLMTQGIVHGTHGYAATMSDAPKDFADEVWSFFGSGTNLQELYITPQRLTGAMWDILAEGAIWSRENADVLVDTHWIGGDPGEEQVYGWASWSPRKGILVLRNPGDTPATIRIDLEEAFELPPDAPRKYRLESPGPAPGQSPGPEIIAGTPHTFSLDPFQTIVYDAAPAP